MTSVTPFLWFDGDLAAMVDFYASVFPDVTLLEHRRNPDGTSLLAIFTVAGQTVYALNGGPGHPFTDAISLFVTCADQAEVDRYWNALTADGKEIACGWLVDKFGLSWQIVPKRFMELIADPDPERVQRAMTSMMGMTKLDVAELERAVEAG